ncbi:MAG: CRISPR-associated endonuclease Cas1 [Thermodesulfobacteriota bacterium]
MERIYVIEPGSGLRKDGDALRVVRPGGEDLLIPAEGLERLTLMGRASLSGAVLDFLIQKRVETVFLTGTGRFRARLLLDEAGHVARRQAQYQRLSQPDFQVKAAQVLVAGKLENQVRFLLGRARRGAAAEVRPLALQIRALALRVAGERQLDALRGLEGAAARLYYQAFALLLTHPELRFAGRNRRPPRDPVNAMLSFAYTLFTNEVLSAVRTAGLDPYLGALHEVAPGRPSLACDLVEEWRVFADRLVLTLCNRRMVGPEDFVCRPPEAAGEGDEEDQGTARPVSMKPAVCRALIHAYEGFMQSALPGPQGDTVVRWLVHGQVQAFGRWLTDDSQPYPPYRIGW